MSLILSICHIANEIDTIKCDKMIEEISQTLLAYQLTLKECIEFMKTLKIIING